jgi:ABC-type nitrate/sulfonate/bicarbonate transport system ATPase subunit
LPAARTNTPISFRRDAAAGSPLAHPLLGNQVILLDEPFSALDALTKSELHRWYLDASAQMGLTTLFITHDIDEALTLSHRIYVMAGMPGQIKAELSISRPPPPACRFCLQQEFLQAKRQLLDAIGGQN